MTPIRGICRHGTLSLACAGALLSLAAAGCGAATKKTASAGASAVSVNVTSPTDGSVIAADHVTVRGTVVPANAIVQVQGKPAAVGNGVFTGVAELHGGKTTIDVIGSAPGVTPGSTHISVVRQSTSAPTRQATVTTVVTTDTKPAPTESAGEIAFFAPSGNVSCVIQGDSAKCSVASIDTTFVLPSGGGTAYRSAGVDVPRGSGSEAPFDTQQSNGSVTCTIPPSNVPAGISCQDNASGHGFEASRVVARQKVY